MQARHDRQRSICSVDLRGRRPVVLQHVLDQVDAAARRIEFVAVQHVGRTGRGAEAAMHAGAQDLFRFRHIRIGKLGESEGGLHRYTPAHMRPALSTPCGSKLFRTRCVNAASAGGSGVEHLDRGAHGGGRADQRRMAAGRCDGGAHQRRAGVVARPAMPPRPARRPSRKGLRRPPLRQVPRPTSAPCVGAVEMRHRSRRPTGPLAAKGVTSRTARHKRARRLFAQSAQACRMATRAFPARSCAARPRARRPRGGTP